jgi:hypothetical protein
VNAGVVNATLGAITPIPAGIFNGAPLFLEVTYDSTTLSPRLDVLTVAYAMRADTADNALQCVNATNAVNATTAVNAVNATTAATATNANHATTADSATTAGSATTASTATTAGSVPWTGVTGVPFTSSGGDNGSASSIARGDHLHDGRYYTKANLQTSGQAQVHWGNVTSRPTLICSAVTHSEDLAPGAIRIVESCCNPGTVLTGGGVLIHGTINWSIYGTHPWGNCWRGQARNNDGVATQALEVFAQCCQL